jgi:hypothetical protein
MREEYKTLSQTCWHICRFTDKIPGDDNHTYVRCLAYRLNTLLIERLNPQKSLTGKELSKVLEEELSFYKEFCITFSQKNHEGSKFLSPVNGLSQNFGRKTRRYHCFHAMGIDENRAQVLRNAVALECNKVAKNAFVLYRGANNDLSVINRLNHSSFNNSKINSFSFGTSLFAGVLYDDSGTPFFYTTEKHQNTFTIVIPHREYTESPFYVPSSHPIVQFSSKGEFFHPRSKVCQEAIDSEYIFGIDALNPRKHASAHLFLNLSSKEIYEKLSRYYTQNCYYLTPQNYQESNPQKGLRCWTGYAY